MMQTFEKLCYKTPVFDTTKLNLTPIRHTKNVLVSRKKTTALKSVKMPSNYSIKPRRERVRKDGKVKLQLNMTINKERIRHPLDIWVPIEKWDGDKEVVTGHSRIAKDTNLEISIIKNRISEILIEMRLGKIPIDKKTFLSKMNVASSDEDFICFWESELYRQEGLLQSSTLRQQTAILTKLRDFQSVIPFSVIDIKFVESWMSWMRLSRGNTDTTIYIALKSFRKYINLAKKQNFVFPLNPSDVKIKSTQSLRTFLSRKELKTIDKFYCSTDCYGPTKDALRRFLFSCYTGLRISDINGITPDNIEGNVLFFKSKKAGKIQRMDLSNKAKRFLNDQTFDFVFPGTKNPTVINRELKAVASRFGITKNISFHCARHTFATQFLELGGDVTVLQKLLGHSNIRESMIYVHITPARKAEGLGIFDAADDD